MAISLYELSQRISSSMPLGTIVPYYGTDEPSGWKICDGRSCAGSELAKKLGISNVPDLRGRFIRMIGGNAAGMAVAQGDCIRNITGTIHFTTQRGAVLGGAFQTYDGIGGTTYNGGNNGQYHPDWKFDASRVVPTGPENRPINTAFNYIIKVNTNVILYYVSNIIYKAIAIGKSLLSRAKEEVRRTMAISLNNHEDRIKVLENFKDGSKVEKILQNVTTITQVGQSIKFTQSFNEYDLVWFEVRSSHSSAPFQSAIWVAYQLGAGEYGVIESTSGTRNGYFQFTVDRPNRQSITVTRYAYVTALWNVYGIRLGLKQ